MTRVAALAVFLIGIGGITIGHAAIGLGPTGRIQPYHQESSIRAVHVNGGYRIVSPTRQHS